MSSTRKLYSLSLVSTSRTDVAGGSITYSIYTVNHKKRATFFSIITPLTPALLARFFFIIFVPVETGRNTLQHIYLTA